MIVEVNYWYYQYKKIIRSFDNDLQTKHSHQKLRSSAISFKFPDTNELKWDILYDTHTDIYIYIYIYKVLVMDHVKIVSMRSTTTAINPAYGGLNLVNIGSGKYMLRAPLNHNT